MRRILIILMTTIVLSFPADVSAGMIRQSEVTLWNGEKIILKKDLFNIRGAIIGSLAITDLGTDGTDEIIIGSGPGMKPTVSVYRIDGTKIFSFHPFDEKMRQGVNVALGDIDGDGIKEIITAPKFNGAPIIKIFTNYGKAKIKNSSGVPTQHEFNAFDASHGSGLSVASADIDGDGKDEIIAAEGPRSGREVRIFKGDGTALYNFQALDEGRKQHGVTLAARDINGDGRAEIIIGEGSLGSRVEMYNIDNLSQPSVFFNAYNDRFVGGVYVNFDMTDATPSIITSIAGDGTSLVKRFTLSGKLIDMRTIYEPTYSGGVLTVTGRLGDSSPYLATAPTSPIYFHDRGTGKLLEVDLGGQRMYAWEDNYLRRTYLISSGLRKTPTPIGEFQVMKNPMYVNYTRIYGQNDPRNYSFPNTRWNLMFKPHYYIHTAWWHSNFGQPMSHGCVNTYVDDAEWVYNFAPVGTRVRIAESLDTSAALATIHKR